MTPWQKFVEATADTAFAIGILFAAVAVTSTVAICFILLIGKIVEWSLL